MGVLFISHSGRDNDAAIKVRDWLEARGWERVFLDLDPEQGLAPGHRWLEELKLAGARCSGVLVLLSPNWLASRWCLREFDAADHQGKKIFPIVVSPVSFDELPLELKAKFQFVDISDPGKEADGFERLAIGLKRAGLDPGSFAWPPPGDPQRAIYRGLQSLDEEDAAIFFGRDAFITKGLDALRRMRDGASERMLVILGASGAGKSSFLKAGLIARLKRDDENFLVLPVIRPERAALSGPFGLAAALSCDPVALNTPTDILAVFDRLRANATDRLRRYAESAHETYTAEAPTIVIPVDQAEELFAAENAEAPRALKLLAEAVIADGNAIIVATIRSDAFAKLQEDSRLADVQRQPFDLAPISHGNFKEVIEGPARLANPPLAIEPALTDQLLEDLAADDALPLLAFTLERLLRRHRGTGALALTEYADELGGLQGAITAAVESAFDKAMRDPLLPHDRASLDRLARAAFIPALVHIDDSDAEPQRRVERLDALPAATRPLVHHLIDERLLVTDHRRLDGVESDTVEVAHEAILRQWPALKSWIAEERDGLRVLDAVRSGAREWHAHGEREGWLAHSGGRLEEAEALLTRPDFADALTAKERDYLAACRIADNSERLREKQSIARTRRLQRRIGVAIGVAAAVVLVATFGIVQLLKGIGIRSSDALAMLAEQASENQDYERAARYALAGLAGANWPLVGFPAVEAERQLRTANALSKRISVLRGHDDVVEYAAYSPDGSRVVTASDDNTARTWDARTGAPLAVLRGHHDIVTYAAYNPNGSRIATASGDKTARIWDSRTGVQLAVLRGHDGSVASVGYSADGTRVVTASYDKTARIWDAQTGAQLCVLRGHDGALEGAAFSRDGARIVTASEDKTVRIWDARTGVQLAVLRGHDGIVESAAYSPDSKYIVSASSDRTVRIWDASTDTQIAVLRGHDDTVNSAFFSPDGARIVTASYDKTARIWDARAGTELAVLRGHDGFVGSGTWSPDGTRIVTASTDRTARIWDARTGFQIAVLQGHDGSVESAAYSNDGTHLVTASTDKTARIWDTLTGAQDAILRGHNDIVKSAAYSPDDARIVTASYDGTARIWDAHTHAQVTVLRGHHSFVTSAAYCPDGTRIVTASADGTARIWNARTGAPLAVLRGHTSIVYTAAYSRDGERIVTGSDDKTARIWDAQTGAQLVVLLGHGATVTSAAYSMDGRRVVTASTDKTARIWDARNGTQLIVLRGQNDVVKSATFSPDDKRIVTASYDRTVRIWDAQTGTQLAILRGHDGAVTSAVYSPDGTRIITTSADKTVRIWRAPQTDASWPHLTRRTLIERTCATLLSSGLDHFSNEELAAAPDLDPKLDANACHPPTLWTRLGELLFASSSH